jgi:hypothetical protein
MVENESFIGPVGATGESIPFPRRKVVYTFSHDTIGDGIFVPMVQQAMAEFIAKDRERKWLVDPEIEDYTASNGVRVRVSYALTDL